MKKPVRPIHCIIAGPPICETCEVENCQGRPGDQGDKEKSILGHLTQILIDFEDLTGLSEQARKSFTHTIGYAKTQILYDIHKEEQNA